MSIHSDLMGIYQQLRTERSPHEPILDQVRDLFMPFRGDMTTKGYGSRKIGSVFDSTGAIAADALVNFMVGNLFPPTSDWVKLRGPEGSNEALDEDSSMIMLELENTNFYTEIAKCLKDLLILGNSVMYVEEREKRLQSDHSTFEGLTFETVNLRDCYWKIGRYSETLAFARDYYLTYAEAARYLNRPIDDEDPFSSIKIIHFVLPRETSPVQIEGDQKFISIWVDPEDGQILRTGGYNYQPYIVSRLDVSPGEQYGRGRGHLARPDAAGSNELKRQILIAASREMNPPLMVEDESIMDTDIVSSGILVMRPATQTQPTYLNSGSNYQVANEIQKQDHDQIKAAFMADILLDPQTQPRSAEESRQRSERLIQRLAGPARTIESEFLSPIMKSVMQIMAQGGALPAVSDMGILEVSFVSPFYVQQRELSARKTWQFVGRRLEAYQAIQDPALLDDLDFDKIAQLDAENSDVPKSIFRDEAEVEQIREARAQMLAQREMAELGGAQMQGPPEQGMGEDFAEQI